jgi:hypothetical protein
VKDLPKEDILENIGLTNLHPRDIASEFRVRSVQGVSIEDLKNGCVNLTLEVIL